MARTVYVSGSTSGSILADAGGLTAAFRVKSPEKIAQVLSQYQMDTWAARASVVDAINAQPDEWRLRFLAAAQRRGVEL